MHRRLLSTNALPLAVALQSVAFVLLAFFALPGTTPARGSGAGGAPGTSLAQPAPAETFQIPRDLEPRHLPVPKLPDFDRPLHDEAPATEEEAPAKAPDPEPPQPALAGLRVQSVALASLVPVSAAAPLPGAPDSLTPHSIDGRSWLAGTRSAQSGPGGAQGPAGVGGGNGGWGGRGIGGSGHGSGGGCPSPGGVGGSHGRPGGPTTAGPRGVSGRGGEGGSGPGSAPPGGERGPAKGKGKGKGKGK